MSWAFLPHHIRWADATAEDRRNHAGTISRLERMAQGLPPVVTDPLVYDRLARLGLGSPATADAAPIRRAS